MMEYVDVLLVSYSPFAACRAAVMTGESTFDELLYW
jgi:hypothetical protein